MKAIILLTALVFSISANADYLTKDNGQVIHIPDGYSACPYDEVYNPKGYDENGEFPAKPFNDGFIKWVHNLEVQAESCGATQTAMPAREDCFGLVLSPSIRDPRCSIYD